MQPAVPRLQSPGEPLVVYETEREREARGAGAEQHLRGVPRGDASCATSGLAPTRPMPTTRAARSAARRAARCLTEVLPTDALGLVLYQLTLAHDIAAVAPTCHQLCDAAKLAQKARPFSAEVVTLRGHTEFVRGVAPAPDGRIITDVEVFRRLYEEVGLGWLYSITKVPFVEALANALYSLWAKNRLSLTGRPEIGTILQEKKMCRRKDDE